MNKKHRVFWFVGRVPHDTEVYKIVVMRTELNWNVVGSPHPGFTWLWGPFKTKRAATLACETYPNPHIQTVSDAEKLARIQK
jgi:hypothetical protein